MRQVNRHTPFISSIFHIFTSLQHQMYALGETFFITTEQAALLDEFTSMELQASVEDDIIDELDVEDSTLEDAPITTPSTPGVTGNTMNVSFSFTDGHATWISQSNTTSGINIGFPPSPTPWNGGGSSAKSSLKIKKKLKLNDPIIYYCAEDIFYGLYLSERDENNCYIYINNPNKNKNEICLVKSDRIRHDASYKGLLLLCEFIIKSDKASLAHYKNTYKKLRENNINKKVKVIDIDSHSNGVYYVVELSLNSGKIVNVRFLEEDIQVIYPSYKGFNIPKDRTIKEGAKVIVRGLKDIPKETLLTVMKLDRTKYENYIKVLLVDNDGKVYITPLSSKIKKVDESELKELVK